MGKWLTEREVIGSCGLSSDWPTALTAPPLPLLRTVDALGVLTGAQIFSLQKKEFQAVSPEEGARVYSQVTVQRALLEVSQDARPRAGTGEGAPRTRTPESRFPPCPPGQRESVRAGGGDGEAKEEGGRRDRGRGHLTLPGPPVEVSRQRVSPRPAGEWTLQASRQ